MTHYSACTIVSNNYLSFARVFARSFVAHHPGAKVWTLIVDRPSDELSYEREPFDVVFAHDLDIPSFENFAFRYSILELNTAVKPYFLEHLHRRFGCEAVCYFDPDILVTGDLAPIYEMLDSSDVVLTPHILEPIEDTRRPSEREFLLSGIYNLGFLGVSFTPGTLRFLDWWKRRLYDKCLHRTEQGLFVDQRWMDFAPAFLNRAKVLRDPGYNVAYWNLPHRELQAIEGGGFRVRGEPLRFFHFSGIEVDEPEAVSKFQDRYSLESRPDVRPLFDDYRRALQEEGFTELKAIPYGFGAFSNGVAIPAVARQLLQKVDPSGERWSDPFDATDPAGFFRWLWDTVVLDGGIELPRLALALWDLRSDLQAAFPVPSGDDAEPYARWFVEEIERSPDLDLSLGVAVARSLERCAPRAHRRGGRVDVSRLAFPRVISRASGGVSRLWRRQVKWWVSSADLESGRRPRIPRLAMLIYSRRSDLAVSYPEPLGESRLRFAVWFVTFGRVEYQLPEAVVRRVLATLPLRWVAYAVLWWFRYRLSAKRASSHAERQRPEPVHDSEMRAAPSEPSEVQSRNTPGLNVVGWLRSPTGVGEVSRGTLEAMRQAGIPHATSSLLHPVLDEAESLLEEPSKGLDPRYGVTLYHVNADMMAHVHRQLPLLVTTPRRYSIGYWFWELAHFPLSYAESFRYVDEIWAPSRFCEQAFSGLSPAVIRWVPPAVRQPVAPVASRSQFGLSDEEFVFFFAFDALSIPERKNPLGLLEAFERVVSRSDRPTRLLLKISHAEVVSDYLQEVRRRAAGLPVTLVEKSVKRETLLGMFSVIDAYVSLHRSEGLGLPMIEAMYLDKPVIATDYGGCTDFLDSSTGWPVGFRLRALDRSYGPYPKGAVWAEPDREEAAGAMLEVLRHPAAAEERVRQARERVRGLYAAPAAGERMKAELERIWAGFAD